MGTSKDNLLDRIYELEAENKKLRENTMIEVPISECDIEEVFKPIAFGDATPYEWCFEATSGQQITIRFVQEEDEDEDES